MSQKPRVFRVFFKFLVQLTANYAEKEVIVKQLGKIPSSIGIEELNKGETKLLGPGGKICIRRQEYPHFVYFKIIPTIKKSPSKHTYTTEGNKNNIEEIKTSNLTDKQISKKRKIEEGDGNDDSYDHKTTKKAKMRSDTSKDCNTKDEQDVKSTCKDAKDMDSPLKNLQSGSPCTTSTWEEIKQELLIYTRKGVEGRSKIAGFDMDGTIITTKSGKVFPTDAADWKIALPEIPGRLKKLWSDGYKIVFFTNQNGIAKKKVSVPDFKKKVENILEPLNVPIQVLVSPGTGHYRKPCTGMWIHLCTKLNQGIDISKEDSFYIGDAAGRPAGWAPGKKKDFSCSDRAFAANIGIKFQTPEEFFLEKKPATFNMPVFDPKSLDTNGPIYTPSTATLVAKEQEVVVMVGYPASGKSMFCEDHMVPHGYVRVNRDTLGSWQKCVTACRNALAKGKSVVVDNTNPDKESRKRFIECARAAKVPVRCFLMDVSREHAQHNNTVRETLNTDKDYKHVGTMVFNIYRSHYVEPSCDEGFSEILKIKFIPKFKEKSTREFYNQFL
ncbi:bifunctional polynucleotide phosphatase/kinase-like isoform X2 [Actinia tenebrosa]|uniref:Bifunctional polynucleotide phosphatase/kinase-like isoform X2 n=1 Tax=Actinia tenebrosa TaxID=6105 RepID=A0A6P8I3U3_ACTTE|nr:bifunctional polynucleotide phosphatase/kinase-like isoform X2 [Actinia tenebrosa]